MARLGRESPDVARQSERRIVDALTRLLSGTSWEADVSPIFGNVQPDLVIHDRKVGRMFVVEVKYGAEPLHFATVAQVDNYARAARDTFEWATDVEPVIITNQHTDASLAETADQLGVHVIEVPPEAGRVATTVFNQMMRGRSD